MSLLPTPTTSDTNGAGAHGDGGTDLRTTVSLLPTPTTTQRGTDATGDLMLPSAVCQLLPTPTARDGKDGQIRREPHRPDDVDTLSGALTVTPLPTLAVNFNPSLNQVVTQTPPLPASAGRNRVSYETPPWGDYAPAIHRWEQILGRPAPAPTMTSAKGNPQLSPRFVEWMMGLPDGWVCDVPGMSRNECLKALGNGVVTQQAVEAVHRLLVVGERAA